MSVISYKCNNFEKHKMLNGLRNLIAIKDKFINYNTNLLHKFNIQIYYTNFRLPFCHLVLSFNCFLSTNVVNYSELTNKNHSYPFHLWSTLNAVSKSR
jgi:hypothetical protein